MKEKILKPVFWVILCPMKLKPREHLMMTNIGKLQARRWSSGDTGLLKSGCTSSARRD